VWNLATNRFLKIYIFTKIYDRKRKQRKKEEINIYRPKNNVAQREMNRAKGTNLRAAAEVLGVGRPGNPPEFIKKGSNGGERRGCRSGRAALQR
jgi:hypothetical protein